MLTTQRTTKILCLLAVTLLVPLAHANLLTVGGFATVSPATPTGLIKGPITGTITTPTFTADYSESVYADPVNFFCSGCLDFGFVFTNHSTSTDALERFTMTSFAGFSTWVATDPFGGLLDPINASRTVSSVVAFNYAPAPPTQVSPGQTTPMLIIETNARTYTKGFLSVQDGTSGFGNALVPSPEPASLALLGSGLAVAGVLMRKFRSR